MKTATRYFVQAGHVDAVRGNVIAHLNTLPEWAQRAYAKGQLQAQPKVYTYKLTRKVDSLVSGTLVTRLARIPQDAKGKVSVLHAGITLDIPVSRLIKVD